MDEDRDTDGARDEVEVGGGVGVDDDIRDDEEMISLVVTVVVVVNGMLGKLDWKVVK